LVASLIQFKWNVRPRQKQWTNEKSVKNGKCCGALYVGQIQILYCYVLFESYMLGFNIFAGLDVYWNNAKSTSQDPTVNTILLSSSPPPQKKKSSGSSFPTNLFSANPIFYVVELFFTLSSRCSLCDVKNGIHFAQLLRLTYLEPLNSSGYSRFDRPYRILTRIPEALRY
jgi:hypothetical protein